MSTVPVPLLKVLEPLCVRPPLNVVVFEVAVKLPPESEAAPATDIAPLPPVNVPALCVQPPDPTVTA